MGYRFQPMNNLSDLINDTIQIVENPKENELIIIGIMLYIVFLYLILQNKNDN